MLVLSKGSLTAIKDQNTSRYPWPKACSTSCWCGPAPAHGSYTGSNSRACHHTDRWCGFFCINEWSITSCAALSLRASRQHVSAQGLSDRPAVARNPPYISYTRHKKRRLLLPIRAKHGPAILSRCSQWAAATSSQSAAQVT